MSQPQLFALSPWETLASPLRAIRIGSWRLFLYSSCVGAITLFLFHEAFRTVDEIISLLPVSRSFASGAKALSRIGWFFSVPFLLTSIAVPVRIIWFSHKINFVDLWNETLPMIRRCWQAMRLTKVRFLVIAIALHQLLQLLQTPKPPQIVAALQMSVVAGILLLFHWLFAVLVATSTNVGVPYGVSQTTKILKHKWWYALLVIVVTLFGASLVRLWAHGVYFLEKSATSLEWVSLSIAGWYALTALTVLALEASEAHARSQGLTFRKELSSQDG